MPPVSPVTSFGSPAAIELAQRISHAIQEYRHTHPGVSDGDVRDALRIADQGERSGLNRRVVVMAAVSATLLAIGIVFAVTSGGGRGRAGIGMVLPMISILVFALTLLFVIVVRRR